VFVLVSVRAVRVEADVDAVVLQRPMDAPQEPERIHRVVDDVTGRDDVVALRESFSRVGELDAHLVSQSLGPQAGARPLDPDGEGVVADETRARELLARA
jgi:hypothetical protein